ncbi:hypothetical protein [Paenibacillus aceti]|uniref:Phage protein n=1 Tax=Paenibacillus aceti TaxID=1820010 RepID=A0ABQ1VPG3_9BACL|nr:hypothetical protein [Paenibacillus aceti]GGF86808.1 hypothetical protein GCM10010913_05380 [Paenibacillus aceti]
MKITGLNDLEKQLKRITENIKKQVDGEVKFEELFNADFMSANTSFSNITEFFDNSPFQIKTQEDFESIDESKLDEYVLEYTKFKSWTEMKQAAGAIYVKKKLNQ